MNNEPSGKFSSKHPENTGVNPKITHEIQIRRQNGRLSCAAASEIAEQCDVSMAEVGRSADLTEVRIDQCILGLFGFEHIDGKKRRVTPTEYVTTQMEQAIRSRLTEGRLTCKSAWDIAASLNVTRYTISQAAEALNIKISRCQIGAF